MDEQIRERLERLEARVKALEELLSQSRTASVELGSAPASLPTVSTPSKPASQGDITVRVTNKRIDSGTTGLFLAYDADYHSTLLKPTRAVKGMMRFCDLFGEPHFMIRTTINRPLEPGKSLRMDGVGFDFNEYMEDHMWLYSHDLSDMTIEFKIESILYADGSRENRN